MKNNIFLILTTGIASLTACSKNHKNENSSQAVEIGNPKESAPSKPNSPRPLQLVQVDLNTAQLNQVSQVKMLVQSIEFINEGRSTERWSASGVEGSILRIVSGKNPTFQFEVPQDVLENASGFQLVLNPKQGTDVTVTVGSGESAQEIPSAISHLSFLSERQQTSNGSFVFGSEISDSAVMIQIPATAEILRSLLPAASDSF